MDINNILSFKVKATLISMSTNFTSVIFWDHTTYTPPKNIFCIQEVEKIIVIVSILTHTDFQKSTTLQQLKTYAYNNLQNNYISSMSVVQRVQM